MFEMSFENQMGKLRLSGGQGTSFRITAVEGLGLMPREFNVKDFSTQAGQVLISKRDVARTITVSGDVYAKKGLKKTLSQMMKVLYHPGKLSVSAGGKKRMIACRCTTVTEPKYRSRELASLVLQFVCDMPYFTDEKGKTVSLFHRKNLIRSSFTLPCIFTEKVCRKQIINAGDVDTEPVITVFNDVVSSDIAVMSLDFGLEVINHTTGQKILLAYETQPGETVTIDIPGRQILSNMQGDITDVISKNSFLSDFVLVPGLNDVEVINYSVDQKIGVLIFYQNRYVEAVV